MRVSEISMIQKRRLVLLSVALVALFLFIAALEGLLSTAGLYSLPQRDRLPMASFELSHKQGEYIDVLGAGAAPKRHSRYRADTAEARDCSRGVSRSPFSLPGPPSLTKPVSQVLQQPWVSELQDFLQTLPSCRSLVSLVAADSAYGEVLLNWLISAMLKANSALSHILVIALDEDLQALMSNRGFSSVLVHPDTVIETTSPNLRGHSAVFLTRLTVLRIINRMGYSVVHYDTDTVILRNPEVLYRRHSGSDVVASIGWWPYVISQRPPGFTLCMGVILFRSTQQTERLWDKMSRLRRLKLTYSQDDQIRLNFALKAMAVKWSRTSNVSSIPPTGTGQGGIKITALPTRQVCRRDLTCKEEERSMYYVWHGKGGKSGKSKTQSATRSGLWFLRSDWRASSWGNSAKGVEWLQQIAL